jgi:hypothetical protein
MRNLSVLSQILSRNQKSDTLTILYKSVLPTSSLVLQVFCDGTLLEGDELIGSIDGGIFAAALSPNGSQLLLVTGLQSLICLATDSWDVIQEVQLTTPLRLVSSKDLSLHDKSLFEVSIAWRFDAQLIAVTGLDSTTNRRVLLIFSADSLALRAQGRIEDPASPHPSSARKLPPPPEPLLLHGPVTWNFDGSLVATAQRLLKPIHTLQIAFFEANGLRHRELVLARGEHAANLVIQQVQWAPNGNTILVVIRDTSSTSSTTTTTTTNISSNSCPRCISLHSELSLLPDCLVQIYYRDNYTWDLKFERQFHTAIHLCDQHPSEVISLKSAEWELEFPLRLRLCTEKVPHFSSSLSSTSSSSSFIEELYFSLEYSVA